VVTQQYIVGELSVLVGGLCPPAGPGLAASVKQLQRRVECSPVSELVLLVHEAIELADLLCWRSLELGDLEWFKHEAAGAVELREFAVCAGLLP
jgi:hypothetical protein